MNLLQFIKILSHKINYLILLPLFTAILVFVLTRNLPVSYSSESTLFTGITSNSGIDLESTGVDFFATQNEYNNILSIIESRDVLEETALRLLTQHLMLDKARKDVISEENFEKLQKITPPAIKKLIVRNDFEKSFKNIHNYVTQDDNNFIYGLLSFDHPYYSIKALNNIKVTRIGTSDLIKITYECEDQGISFNTVRFLCQIFIEKYGMLKNSQWGSAVLYFEKKLKESNEKLNKSEDSLLAFNTKNDIINYDEQTKHVSSQQETIDIRLQEIKMELDASHAVLIKLESEIVKRYHINLRTKDILNIRSQLIAKNNAIAKIEVNEENSRDKASLLSLKQNRKQLEHKLASEIDSTYIYESNSQGIESQKLLGEWLDAIKSYESNSALYKSMQERKKVFMTQYKQYAPLGAMLKRIDRGLIVNEKEYIEILHHLGLARLNQNNADMLSKMKIMDEAKFPINAIPSNRKLYVILSTLFSLIFYILGVFIVELLDQRISSPFKLKKHTGLEVLSAFCINENEKYIYTDKINERAAVFIYGKIRELSFSKNKPVTIQIFSNWEQSGRTFVSAIVNKELEKHGFDCITLKLSGLDKESEISFKQLRVANNYNEFTPSADKSLDYLISVLPPISEGIENPQLIKTGDINFLVFDARSTWTKADTFNLEKLKHLLGDNLFAILTCASPHYLDEMYGEIPQKRSRMRIWIKKVIKQFT
jgi:succinoglycan biosynthesis transport protein ExoP